MGRNRRTVRHSLGWALSAFIVTVALLGAPLTGESIHPLDAFRHHVLMLDREFETISGWCLDTTLPSNTINRSPASGRKSA